MPETAVPEHALADGLEPVLAWRVWRVALVRTGWRRREPILRAVSDDEAWLPGEPKRARCRTRPHTAPAQDCRCGLYGMIEPAPPPYGLPSGGFIAVGRVAFWGDVVIHPDGCRAAFGYPQLLGFFCMRCLEERRAEPAVIVVPDSPYGPLCSRHRGRLGMPVEPILEQLLATYAIERQLPEPLSRAMARAKEPEMNASYWRSVIT